MMTRIKIKIFLKTSRILLSIWEDGGIICWETVKQEECGTKEKKNEKPVYTEHLYLSSTELDTFYVFFYLIFTEIYKVGITH